CETGGDAVFAVMRGWGDAEQHGLGRQWLPEAVVVPHPRIPASPHLLIPSPGVTATFTVGSPVTANVVEAISRPACANAGRISRVIASLMPRTPCTGARKRRASSTQLSVMRRNTRGGSSACSG